MASFTTNSLTAINMTEGQEHVRLRAREGEAVE